MRGAAVYHGRDMAFSPGTRLGPFEILGRLDLAGMGEAYRVRDHERHRDAAMWVLRAEFEASPRLLKRFEEEVAASAPLSHPAILAVHDVGTDAHAAYVISEPIEGRTLRAVLGDGRLRVRTAIKYAAQIADALAAAHEMGVVHRDLKPEHILVAGDGHVRVAGFGLAAITRANPAPARPRALSGGAPAGSKSDMLAFGAVVYEMLTGTPALDAGTRPLDALSAELQLPPVLAQVIDLCLRKNPVLRPSPADAASALHGLLESAPAPPAAPVPPVSEPVTPPPPTVAAALDVPPPAPQGPPVAAPRAAAQAMPRREPPRASEFVVRRARPRRRVGVMAAAAAAAVVALVLLVPIAWQGLQSSSAVPAAEPATPPPTAIPDRPAEAPAPMPEAPPPDPNRSRLVWLDRTGSEVGVVGNPADYGDVSLSPDGMRVAASVREPGAETADIVLIDVAGGMETRLTSDAGDDTSPVWSPDGQRLVYASTRNGSSDIYQTAAGTGGGEAAVVDAEGDQIASDWSPDGRYLLYQTDQPDVADGGNFDLWVRILPAGPSFAYLRTIRTATVPKLSPDRRWVAFVSVDAGRSDIYVAPFPRYSTRTRVSQGGGSWPRWRRDGSELFYVDAEGRLTAVPVRSEPAVTIGQPAPLFPLRAKADLGYAYDVSADGERFLVNATGLP